MSALIHYDEPIFRPPSEARSLILQLTLGCSYNRCAFCAMYRTKRFRIRPLDAVRAEIERVAAAALPFRRVFLADGDALVCRTAHLLAVLETLGAAFPELQRISIYSSPQAIRRKSVEELAELREAGLSLHFLGVESGDDLVLERMNKGCDADEMIALGGRVQEAGARLSTMILGGLGGTERWREHARGSARVISALSPRFLSVLTVTPVPTSPLHEEWGAGRFHLPDPLALTRELREFLAALDVRGTIFRANHASNYLPIGGNLPRDQDALLATLDEVLAHPDQAHFTPESQRGL